MTIRVFIVDDHALVRTGMRMILGAEPDIEIVGEADSGDTALPHVRRLRPDVVLCDLHLPGMSGLEITERIVKGNHGTRVVIVSVLEDGPLPRRLLEVGASGYVGKGADAGELLRAVRAASQGQRYLARSIAQHLAFAGMGGNTSPVDELTPRELEICLLLAQGRRPGEIAQCLSLSPKTVSTHKSRLFEKLGVGDSMALARLLKRHRILEDEVSG